ncbi:MAG: sulfatase-like hydrolase/transferase [Burkholderiaceae bacterium]
MPDYHRVGRSGGQGDQLAQRASHDRPERRFHALRHRAPHSPHHAPKDIIDTYQGVFDDGWDLIREQTFARQKALGVAPQDTILPSRNPGIRAWDSLTDDERRCIRARWRCVCRAFVEHTDTQIGRLLDHLRATGQFENTMIYLMSDNGASAEGGMHGLSSEITYFNGLSESIDDMMDKLEAWGDPSTYPHYAAGWAYAGSTPQRWYKAFVHEGGTRDPLIVSWPRRIGDGGGIRDQFLHVVDIATTVYELLGITLPDEVDGVPQRPLEGTSISYTFDAPDAPTQKQRQYFELYAHRAIWADGWKAVTMHPSRGAKARIGDPDMPVRMGRFDEDIWELYHLTNDFSESTDLAATHPDKLAELQAMWWEDARRYNVLPLDDRVIERSQEPRPRLVRQRDSYTFTGPIRLVRSVSPSVLNRDHNIVARIDTGSRGCEGVIVSNGGLQGGYTLCIQDGHLVYASNYLGRRHTVLRSEQPLPAGEHTVAMSFTRTEPYAGQATLYVDGLRVAQGAIEKTNPVIYAVAEGLEVGSDTGTAVWPGYSAPFRFTGRIIEVTLTTVGALKVDPEAEDRIARYTQ